jgi:SSS family solute:Na+ symporter
MPLEVYGLVAYLLMCFGLAWITRKTSTFSEFSVGSRKVPAAMIFASIATTYIGPGFSVGFTGKGYATGFLFWLLTLTYAAQTILVGVCFAPRLSRYRDCYTIGDVMERQYGRFTHLLAGIVSVGLCIGFTAIMGKIGGQLLASVTGMSVPISIAIVTLFTAFYTFTGGVRAVIANDGIQFLWFCLIIPAMALLAYFKCPVSTSEVAAKAAELTRSGFREMTGMQIFAIIISFLLGETLTPPYANRALSARTAQESKIGFVLGGVFCPIWLGLCAVLGVYGHFYLSGGMVGDEVFYGLGRHLLNPFFFGCLMAGVVAIIMSSQEALMNSGSVAFVRDIIGISGNLSDKTQLIAGRAATLGMAVIAVVVAQFAPSIIDGLLICYSIWAPSLLLPFLLGLYVKNTKPAAGYIAMIMGGIVSIVWQTVLKEPWGIPAILVGLVASFSGWLIGQWLGKEKAQA